MIWMIGCMIFLLVMKMMVNELVCKYFQLLFKFYLQSLTYRLVKTGF